MTTKETQLARKLIRALTKNWVLVEDIQASNWWWTGSLKDFLDSPNSNIPYEGENLILVNESRLIMKEHRPSRSFIQWLEENGYLENHGTSLQAPPILNEYQITTTNGEEVVVRRNPHVYSFQPTSKGLALLETKKVLFNSARGHN